MTPPAGSRKTCPHCGAPSTKGSKVPLHLISSVLVLTAALFLWNARRAGSNVDGQQSVQGRLTDEEMDYIASGSADNSCRACLTSADNFIEQRRLAALKEKLKDMARIPAGEYEIGSPDGVGDPDEHPRHKVRLDAFFIDNKETTIADYMRFASGLGTNYPEWAQSGGRFNIETGQDPYYKRLTDVLKNCPDCPVIGISSLDAKAYCSSRGKRLPTEAEWETAARGGSGARYSFGDDALKAADHAWYEDNSNERPHAAGGKQPNAYGIYDMHGNVWEWTADIYDAGYYKSDEKENPKGPERGHERVIRGGSWAFDMDSARAANRASSSKANDDIGFRCAISESEAQALIGRK